MNYLSLNLLLAIVWTFLLGSFSVGTLLFGFVAGFVVLLVAQPFIASMQYVRSVVGLVRFLTVYAYELMLANVQLARDLLRRALPFEPGFLRFDASSLSVAERVVLANMISLTPGTMTVDYDDQGRTLYIHTLYAQDPERMLRGIALFANLIDGVTGHRPPAVDDEDEAWKHS